MFSFNNIESGISIKIKAKRFDASVVRQFKAETENQCPLNTPHIEVDLSEVGFIDSSGIGALLSLRERLAKDAENIVIINPRPAVLSIIELLKLNEIFTLKRQ